MPIDLSTGNGLPAAVEAALTSALNGIPGVRTISVNHFASRTGSGASPALRLSFMGWAPTLHAAHLTLSAEPTLDPRAPGFTEQALAALEDDIARQRARAEAGIAHNVCRPLAVRPHDSRSRIEMRHLHVDAALPVLARENGLADLSRVLREAVREMLDGDSDHDGGPMIKGETEILAEIRGLRVVGADVHLSGEPGRSVRYDGFLLDIAGRPVPDTALAAAVGRPLGDLVRVHRALDARVIRHAECEIDDGHPLLHIALEPDWTPWSTIEPEETPA